MRVLVTGGTGFIGSNLALRLLADGHDMFMTGTDGEQTLPQFQGRVLPRDFSRLDWGTLGPIDVVFHQAAINDTTLMDRAEMFRVNVEGSKALFEAAARHGCRRIVYASSTAAYGDAPAPYHEEGPLHPLNPYGESKMALDQFAMVFAREHPEAVVIGLRYCNVYGPREAHKGKRASMIFQLAQQMAKGSPRLFQYGEQKRDYIFVDDAVRLNLRALASEESCVVNCGSGTATTFNELVTILNGVLNTERVPEYIENPYAAQYQSHTECDMSLAREKLGFVPAVDIRSGIQHYFERGDLVREPLQATQASATVLPTHE